MDSCKLRGITGAHCSLKLYESFEFPPFEHGGYACARLLMKRPMNEITDLVLVSLCRSAEEDVLELSDSDFSSVIEQHDTALVMFYAPWCGHCKKLKPEYALAAGILKNDDPPVTLAKVDCTDAGKSTCEKFSVSGYPTLKIFRKGELSQEYNGPRESNGIVKYMRAQVGPSSKELRTAEDFEAFIGKDDVVVVGFFEKETDLKAHFLKTADSMREQMTFAHSTSNAVLDKAGYKDSVVLYRPKRLQNKFEDSVVVYKGDPETYSLKAFIKENYHGLVGIRQKDNAQEFTNPLIVAYYDVDYVKNPKGTNYWRNRVLKAATELKDVTFAVSDKDEFMHELNEYGIDFAKGDKPLVAGRDKDSNKFVMSKEFSIENLREFAQDMVAGKLEAFIKSEPLPDANAGPVKVAVGKNFKELVTDSGRDALVEFYAPWCGHCQKLAPVWDELAEKLKDEDVDIVKLDATANDWPKSLYEVSGFPTIYWKPADASKKPVRYNGGRGVDDFIKYISEQATNELKAWDRKGKAKKEEL
ncbi:Protein disulfide-isomerase A3 [Eumeta japonica]|uniref:Protein disulfide-isomerase n=1 Tax=Eumeta variegata TaxID=151549 RepID=A0A4C1SAW5_EUMVA|nr:Protein disulfide-isomerase A3 [Eumeta japonica]